ncbi:anti-sigma factor family protein [Pseudonocardia bannensis]|uniref:Zinc-finger domain-containing protein n=1 Tax=Pseudonocardia bannensis TaxID=630973 RepID=A0A848DHK1_9PSEU|nr:hypothetical protein [Pseudonocardia bannensis]NMH91974.1 hypothetical protein [Pseudonocardia bannensis]
MTEHDCEHYRDSAPELALGMMTGRERAAALTHLQCCPACRALVEGLTRIHDRLRALIPDAEPQPGFESRVLDRLHPVRPTAGRRMAAAIAVAVVLLGLGWAFVANTAPGPPGAVAAGQRSVLFAALTTKGREIGQAYAYPGEPSWLYMYLEAGRPGGMVTCTLLFRDGTGMTSDPIPIVAGDAFWGGPAPVDRTMLTGLQVTDEAGQVIATGRFDVPGWR